MNRHQGVFVALALLGAGAVCTSAFASDACGTAKVVPGDACGGGLGVKFDLSGCGDSGGTVRIKCSEEGAVAVVETERASYSVGLKVAGESWGQKTWEISGFVTQIPKQVQASTVKPSRSPAGWSAVKKVEKHKKEPEKVAATQAPPSVATPAPAPTSAQRTPSGWPAVQATPTPEPVAVAQPSPAPSPSPEPSGIAVSGFFDMYFGHNFNRPEPVAQTPPYLQASQNQLRNFDLYSNSFALNLAELSLVKKGKEISLHADLDFGQQANYMNGGTSSSAADDVSKNIGQAYLTYTPEKLPDLTVNVGKMYAFLGYETPKSKDNWNYSRSFLFSFALPVWFTGANAIYQIAPGQLALGAHVYNGWNTLYSDNSGKTYGLQLTYTPTSAWTFNLNLLTGPQNPDDTTNYKTIYEGNAQWVLSPKLSLAADLAAGKSAFDPNSAVANGGVAVADGKFESVETLAKYSITPTVYLSPRVEYFWDPEGAATQTDQDLYEGTMTFGYTLTEGLENRIEWRYDHSNSDPFVGSSGQSSHQMTLEFAVLYSF
jgi:hypothetical protein